MSAPGQAAMFASGKRRKGRREHDTQAWPDELLPLSAEFCGDVAHTGGYSSGTETKAGAAVARSATACWCPTGRMKYSGKSAPFGSQVCRYSARAGAVRATSDGR